MLAPPRLLVSIGRAPALGVGLLLAMACIPAGCANVAREPEQATTAGDPRLATAEVDYTHDDVALRGYAAWDRTVPGRRPGILVVHQWKGLGEYERMRARMLAGLGYFALAVDVYGADTRPTTNHEAAMAVTTFRNDRGLFRARLLAALEALRRDPRVDPERTAAIGYCFGGTGVLELARAGADLDAVVSFHGGLSNPSPETGALIIPFVQVHHAARDASVSQDEVTGFWREMNASNARWDLRIYSGALHGFTERGPRYDERADRESWEAMMRLFEEIWAAR